MQQSLIQLLEYFSKSKTKSLQQIAVLISFLLTFSNVFQENAEPFAGKPDRTHKQKISTLVKKINADAVVIHKLVPHTGLEPSYSSSDSIEGVDIDAFSHDDLLDQLQLGNCVRQEKVALDVNGLTLSAIMCPILREDGLNGTISAVFYDLPDLNSDGTDDPAAGLLFITGIGIR